MGQIRKRGKYDQIRYYRNGQRIEESTGFTKYDEARDELRKREGDISKGVPIAARSTRLLFDDAVKDVEADYTIKGQRSLAHLQRRIRLHLTPVFGGRRLTQISAADLRAFAAKRTEAWAKPTEINRELAIVRRAYRLAIASEKYHGRVPAFPMMSERASVRQGFFEAEALASVMGHLPAEIQPVVRFASVTGWRIQSEVLPLEWRQVDRQACTVRLDIGSTKNGQGRHSNYADNHALVQLFEAQWQQADALKKQGEICRHVFHRHGKRIKDFRGPWKAACKAAGVPGRLPARSQEDGRAQLGTLRRARFDRDEGDGPPDQIDFRQIRHHV